MKPFSEMSQEEIEDLSEEQYNSISPFEKKTCYDCIFLKSKISWWCTNEEAIKARGTAIPPVIKCDFWHPNYGYIEQKWISLNPPSGQITPHHSSWEKLKNIFNI